MLVARRTSARISARASSISAEKISPVKRRSVTRSGKKRGVGLECPVLNIENQNALIDLIRWMDAAGRLATSALSSFVDDVKREREAQRVLEEQRIKHLEQLAEKKRKLEERKAEHEARKKRLAEEERAMEEQRLREQERVAEMERQMAIQMEEERQRQLMIEAERKEREETGKDVGIGESGKREDGRGEETKTRATKD